MLKRILIMAVFVWELLGVAESKAQVYPTVPKHWLEGFSVPLNDPRYGLCTNNHLAVTKLVDSEAVRVVVKANGISDEELSGVQVVASSEFPDLRIYWVSGSRKMYGRVCAGVASYLRERYDGHSKEFVLTVITNRASPPESLDADLERFLMTAPEVSACVVSKVASGVLTNPISSSVVQSVEVVGTVAAYRPPQNMNYRWIKYVAIDGDRAWAYTAIFKDEKTLPSYWLRIEDAREYDAKYKDAINEAKWDALEELKREGNYERPDSLYRFWKLTKERLKVANVDWSSPRDLNPRLVFDPYCREREFSIPRPLTRVSMAGKP